MQKLIYLTKSVEMSKFDKTKKMKRTLLLATLAFSFLGNAQSLTSSNEPAIGETASMFLCDSFTIDYASITGTGVTWDYSNLVGITGQTRLVSVLDATTAPNAADFSTSVKAISVESSMTNYITSTASDRTSQGFVFNEPSLGDVVAVFSSDPEVLMTYPFAFGSTSTDVFSGSVNYTFGGIPQTSSLTGNVTSEIDGQGTMNFPSGITVNNVIRYHIIDSSTILAVPILGDLEIIRNQFEYYASTSNLPIFSVSKLTIQAVGSTTPINEFSLVLSSYAPAGWLAIEDTKTVDFSVYPNPTNDNVTISGEFGSDAKGEIIDQSGRTLSSFNVSNHSVADLSSLESGVYFLRITDNGSSITKNIVKK